jgi:hypothetical protein
MGGIIGPLPVAATPLRPLYPLLDRFTPSSTAFDRYYVRPLHDFFDRFTP